MTEKTIEKFRASDFILFTGLENYVARNNLGFSEEHAGFGHPDANLKAYNRACFLQLYNIPFGITNVCVGSFRFCG